MSKPAICIINNLGRADNIDSDKITNYYHLLNHLWVKMQAAGSGSGAPEKLFVNGVLVQEGLWDAVWKFGSRRTALNKEVYETLLKEFPQPWEDK